MKTRIILSAIAILISMSLSANSATGTTAATGTTSTTGAAGAATAPAAYSPDWKGRVLDEKGEALPYATVILYSMPDSTVVGGTASAEDGTYVIEAGDGDAKLMVSMIGFKTAWVESPAAGDIRLEPDTEMISGATVSAVMPKTKLTDQGLLTSVRGSVLENVGTAEDALARVPGLMKGQNGLEVLGKGAPLVYINGRKVTDAKELERLQSNEIQNVEVITNPGAQYDATIRSVVRIRTIKRQGDGFGFSMGLSDDQSLRHDFNDPSGYLNMNFRHNGLDVFAGVNALKFTSSQESEMMQQTFGDPGFKQEGDLYFVQGQTNIGYNAGVNWQINDNHSLGFRVDGSTDTKLWSNQTMTTDIYRGGSLIDKLKTEGEMNRGDLPASFKLNAYYNGNAGKLNIDFNADYYGVRLSENSRTREFSGMASDDVIDFRSNSDSRMYAAKLVLSYPIWQGALQFGTEDVFTRRGDDYTIESALVPSSASKVSEDNIAAFASYGFYIPKAGQFSAGIRYEHVNYRYDDLIGNDNLERRYDNFFPTVSYANAFGPVQLQASYSAKTSRPDFYSLSSAVRYHSRYILQSGNSRLQPQTSHDFGLNVNWKFLTMVTQYTRVNDAISQWSELYNSDGVVLVRPINLDSPVRTFIWYLNASPTIGIWSLNCTAGVQQQWLRLDSPDAREASGRRTVSFSDKPMWIVQLFNTFRFKNSWQIELGGEFHSKAYAQNALLTSNYFNLSAAIQKSFLDNALVVRLSADDLTGTANYDVMTDCGSHIIKQTNIMDTKRMTLSVRYNFNTASNKYKGTGAGQETMRRMSGK